MVKSIKFAGRRIFVPTVLRDEEAEEIVAILENEVAKSIFLHVLNNQDTYPLEIARSLGIHHETVRYHLEAMQKVRLVDFNVVGKKKHVREGPKAKQLKKSSINIISDSFISFLLSHLRNECLYPEVVQKDEKRLPIRLECPGQDEIILDLQLGEWKLMDVLTEE